MFIKGKTFLISRLLDFHLSLVRKKNSFFLSFNYYHQIIDEMSTNTDLTKEEYEKLLTKPLLSEEALMLLNPYYIRIEQAYYEHGVDRPTFLINNLEYSIHACLITFPTLYFVGFNRTATSEIYSIFQAALINKKPSLIFVKIARNYLWGKFFKLMFCGIKPQTTREALDYVGLSNEAQINILKLEYPTKNHRAEFMLRHITVGKLDTWAM